MGDWKNFKSREGKSVLVFTIGSLGNEDSSTFSFLDFQLFWEWLSEEVHATILKSIVGGFGFTVLSKKFERMTCREAMDVCLWILKESNKSRFDSYSVRNSVLIISHITFWDCCMYIFTTTFLEIAVYILRKQAARASKTGHEHLVNINFLEFFHWPSFKIGVKFC